MQTQEWSNAQLRQRWKICAMTPTLDTICCNHFGKEDIHLTTIERLKNSSMEYEHLSTLLQPTS